MNQYQAMNVDYLSPYAPQCHQQQPSSIDSMTCQPTSNCNMSSSGVDVTSQYSQLVAHHYHAPPTVSGRLNEQQQQHQSLSRISINGATSSTAAAVAAARFLASAPFAAAASPSTLNIDGYGSALVELDKCKSNWRENNNQ